MLTYPQLAHFPIVRRRQRRTVVNRAADGRTVKLADPAGEVTEWRLSYAELSDGEAAALQQFFLAAEGSLKDFVFVDPTANLLRWSAKLDEADWAKGPMLSASPADGVWRLTNAGGAAQAITQTIEAPVDFVYCFSVYARSETATTVRLLAGGLESRQTIGPSWRRLQLTASVADTTFGLEIGAGETVEVRGMQVEAQWSASIARASVSGGVYEGARLRDDHLETIATGMNRHSCTVNIVHANHI
jgi:hypothetical protein